MSKSKSWHLLQQLGKRKEKKKFTRKGKNKEREKFTSGLAEGLVEEALSPLRETMQAWDGAMKSLRSPIRSVAENFSDITLKPTNLNRSVFSKSKIWYEGFCKLGFLEFEDERERENGLIGQRRVHLPEAGREEKVWLSRA